MVSDSFFKKNTTINFTVINMSSKRRIHVFNYPIDPGQTRDLLSIPEISEDDIRSSLIKGELANFIRFGVVKIVSSSIDLTQYDPQQTAFINTAGGNINVNSSSNYAAQTTWFIDGKNSTGLASDINDGKTATTPLLTDRERARRIGNNVINTNVTVNLLSSLQSTDVITEPYVALNGFFLFTGRLGVTILHSGTLTAVTAQNGNNPFTLTNSAVTWTTDGPGGTSLVGNRFRITSGPNINTICGILGTSSAHVAIVSDPELLATDPAQFQLTSVTPTIGDHYQIESLPVINGIVGSAIIEEGYTANFTGTRIMYEGVSVTVNQHGMNALSTVISRQFVGCSLLAAQLTTAQYLACLWGPTSIVGGSNIFLPPGNAAICLGCGFIIDGGFGGLVVSPGSELVLDQGAIIVGGAATSQNPGGSIEVHGWLGIGEYDGGTYVGPGAGIINSAGDGVVVRPGGVVYGRYVLWGSGNANYGIRVQSGGQVQYVSGTKPTLTGTSGDTIIGGTVKAYAAIPFVNTTNNAIMTVLA